MLLTAWTGSTHLSLIGCDSGISDCSIKPDTYHEVKGHPPLHIIVLLTFIFFNEAKLLHIFEGLFTFTDLLFVSHNYNYKNLIIKAKCL